MFNSEAEAKSGSQISPEPSSSMQEYYQLQQNLLLTTLAMTGAFFVGVCIFYPLDIALNYLIGALVSIVYLRMLGRDVERLGKQDKKISRYRLALIAAVIIIATQLHQLKILPIFLGFLTYKAALIIYVLRTTFTPEPNK